MYLPFIVQTAICALSLFMVFGTAAMRGTPKSRYFMLLALAVLFYNAGYLFELGARSLETGYMALRVQYLGVAFYATFFYLFVRDYANRPIRHKWSLALLFAFPLAVLVMMNAYPASHLYYRQLSFVSLPPPHIVFERGPFFTLFICYDLLLILVSVYEVLRYLPRCSKEQRQTRLVFVVALIIPSIMMALFTLGQSQPNMQLGPLATTLSLLLLGSFIIRKRAEDWLPFAREQVMEHINDGYILLDNNGCFLDANRQACVYFPAVCTLKPNDALDTVEGFPADLLTGNELRLDFSLTTADGLVWLRASSSTIRYQSKPVCTCILLYDIAQLYRLMSELKEIATHDELTGLQNRSQFFRMAERDINLHYRTKQPAALLLIDIDRFKRVNDGYGHPAGDLVLHQVAARILHRLRQTDIEGRYGGEEFVVFLPATAQEGALKFAEDIRQCIAEAPFGVYNQNLRVTVSIGVAMLYPPQQPSLAELIREADSAMYAAKQNGRNRVELYAADELELPGRQAVL